MGSQMDVALYATYCDILTPRRHSKAIFMKKADPGATSSKTTQRVQFELPPSTYERLCSLKDKTEAASYTEVIKNALKLYESLLSESEAGGKFLVKSQDGSMKEYILF